jgi:broad specificity phosphatase PhoE
VTCWSSFVTVGLRRTQSGGSRVGSIFRWTMSASPRFGVPYDVDDRWTELDYGQLDGMPVADVDDEVWARWRVDPRYQAGGGESMAAMNERVITAAEELLSDAAAQMIVVTTHVSPIKAAMAWALGVDISVGWRCHLDQASVCRIAASPSGPVLIGFNETRR